MPYLPPRRYRPERPDPASVARTMTALAASPEAQARVAAFAARALGVEPAAAAATPAPTGTASHARRGLAVEGEYRGRGAAAVLRREGYHPTRAQDSKGPWDVVGVRVADGSGPAVRLVQVKRRAVFTPSALNEAVRGLLPHPVSAEARREAWLWVDGTGWAARVALATDGSAQPLDGAQVQEVTAAITKALARERDPGQGATTHGPTFEERLRQ